MTTTNITNFRKNAFNYVEQTIKYNEPLNISTKDGDAVLLSAEDYSGLMETLYLVSVPGMREKNHGRPETASGRMSGRRCGGVVNV